MEGNATAAARRIDLRPLDLRAAFVPASVNVEARTAELVFSTGAPVERYDWDTGERYLETLSLNPEHIRLGRLNDGGPVLDSHSAYSVGDILGAVVPGTVTVNRNGAKAKVRFARGPSTDEVWGKVADGIIRSVSVGYRVYRFEETEGGENKIPTRKAVDWEPFEISMVPIPADAGAKVREGKSAEPNRCDIVPAAVPPSSDPTPPTRGEAPADQGGQKGKTVENDKPAESFVADLSLKGATPTPPPAPPEPTDADRATETERARVVGIDSACRAGRMPVAFRDELVTKGVPLVEAQTRVFEEMRKRGNDDFPRGGGPRIEVTGEGPGVHVRAGIVEALCYRAHPRTETVDGKGKSRTIGFELTERARPYMGLDLVRIAERLLVSRGVDTARLTGDEIASLALRGFSGGHTTSDFPILLADVANKTLRAGYDEAPQTFAPITRRTTVPDFKDVKRTQFGEAPTLAEVNEHGEITSGTITEGREVYSVSTYGKIFAVTRKAIVNDDLGAFTRVPMLMGRQAANLESDLVWNQITGNPLMGDGNALFSTPHANLDSTGAAIGVDSIGAGRAAMRVQKGLDGATLLNITPRFLIVPAALETLADQFVSQIVPNAAGSVNPFGQGGRMPLQVIAEPRLDRVSDQQWYLSASIGEFPDIVELATLAGQGGPRLDSEMGFEIEGVKFRIVYDVGAKVIDWRPLYRNAGV